MDKLCYVDPPNRPAEKFYTISTNYTLHNDFVFVDTDDTGRILLGTTDVNASFWEGSVQTFENYKSYLINVPTDFHNGFIMTAGKLLPRSNCMLFSESPCYLKLIQLTGDLPSMQRDVVETTEKVTNISVWDNQNKIVTSSENIITLWNIPDEGGMEKIHEYSMYHTDEITSAAVKKSDPHIFASTSKDKRLCLWDMRMEEPALVTELYSNEFSSLNTLSWNPSSQNIIAVGTDSGDVYLVDVNHPKDFINVQHCFKAPVFKIQFSPAGKLAVCGNNCDLQVYCCKNNEFDCIYKETYGDFVRDLAWSKEALVYCGLDLLLKQITL